MADGIVETPTAVQCDPPSFVTEVTGDRSSGTVVVIESLDQLSSGFVITRAAVGNLLSHLGTTYRGVLHQTPIHITDTAPTGCGSQTVQPIDPLFLNSAARYHDDGHVYAEPVSPTQIDVRAPGADHNAASIGTVTVRYSYLAPGFQDGDNRKARLSIMTENNGLLALRAGRQVDVVRTTPKGTGVTIGQVYDRNWGCEINFPPSLDEEFGVTVNKQQVSLSDRMWSLLTDHGVFKTVHHLQRRYESTRVCRRLPSLTTWSHEQVYPLHARGPAARRSPRPRPGAQPPLAVGRHPVRCRKDRLHRRDAPQLGPPGRA